MPGSPQQFMPQDTKQLSSDERLASLWQPALETLPFGIALLDAATGRTLWRNAVLHTMLKGAIGRQDILQKSPMEYLPGLKKEDWETVHHALLQPAVEADAPTPPRLQFVHHSTRNIAYWEWLLKALDAQTPPQHLMLVVQSVSDMVMNERLLSSAGQMAERSRQEAEAARKTAESALAEARAAQQQMVQMEKMRAIGELASGVAHDFNNALMTILGYAELAEDTIDDPETLKSQLAIIQVAAQDAASTVQRLQSFARQRTEAQGQISDINAIVRDVVEMTRPRWKDTAQKEGRAYQIRTDLGDVPPVLLEPSGIREVLINLIHNALHAMPAGGALTLTTRQHGENAVRIEVADTGVGMSSEVAARIFDPFFTTRGVEGTGLGLSVSWSIVQRHGGTLEVESTPGEGARFRITLPCHPQTSLPTLPAEPAASEHKLSILVMDDETLVTGILTGILTREGYQVVSASGAEPALEYLRDPRHHFDLVLTDHGMPGMNGLQLLAESKRLRPSLPVVLLTGWGQSLLSNHETGVQPDAILGKPILRADLLAAIAQVQEEAQSRRSDATK